MKISINTPVYTFSLLPSVLFYSVEIVEHRCTRIESSPLGVKYFFTPPIQYEIDVWDNSKSLSTIKTEETLDFIANEKTRKKDFTLLSAFFTRQSLINAINKKWEEEKDKLKEVSKKGIESYKNLVDRIKGSIDILKNDPFNLYINDPIPEHIREQEDVLAFMKKEQEKTDLATFRALFSVKLEPQTKKLNELEKGDYLFHLEAVCNETPAYSGGNIKYFGRLNNVFYEGKIKGCDAITDSVGMMCLVNSQINDSTEYLLFYKDPATKSGGIIIDANADELSLEKNSLYFSVDSARESLKKSMIFYLESSLRSAESVCNAEESAFEDMQKISKPDIIKIRKINGKTITDENSINEWLKLRS